jgi:hypothetical protein
MPIVHHYPATGNYCVWTCFYRAGGKEMSFRLFFTGDIAVTQPYNPDLLATAIYNHIKTPLLDCFDVAVTVLGGTVSVRNALQEFSGYFTAGDAGMVSGVALPDELNAILRKVTDTAGAVGRGRLRLAGMSDAFVAGNYITSSGNSAYVALATVLKTQLTDQSVVWSPANFSPKTAALHAMLDVKVQPKVGTDRRRRVRF